MEQKVIRTLNVYYYGIMVLTLIAATVSFFNQQGAFASVGSYVHSREGGSVFYYYGCVVYYSLGLIFV